MRGDSGRVLVRWRLRLLQGLFSERFLAGRCGARSRGEMRMKPVAKKKEKKNKKQSLQTFFFSLTAWQGFMDFPPSPCRSAFTVHLFFFFFKTGPFLREKYVNFYASNPLQNRQKHCRELKKRTVDWVKSVNWNLFRILLYNGLCNF